MSSQQTVGILCERCNVKTFIRKQLFNILEQSDFTGSLSCLTNMLIIFKSWTEDVDQGHSVDVMFGFWIQDAVDKVLEKRLLQNLSAYGRKM